MAPAGDNYLVKVAAGDRRAMQDCIERYSKLVWSIAVRLTRSRADAEDAVQEIFVTLWQNAARFDATRASEPTFVAMIARRKLIDRLRRQGRTPTSDVAAFDPDVMPAADDLHATLEMTSEARAAARVLAELPAERRRVVALSVVEGMTQEEIAQKTALPLGTVKSHLRRGLLAVRAALGQSGQAERSVAT